MRERKVSRSAVFQPGSQNSASSSMCRALMTAPRARANVVLPLPVVPMTETRFTVRDDILGHTPVKLHEYQAKQLLARAGIPIPEGRLATTPEEAQAAARALCFDAGIPAAQRNAIADIAMKLYGVYARTDAMLVEINPLFIQTDGSVLAGDAKLDMDDNALFRQTELRDWKEISPDEEAEERARALGFSYVQLDGNVGVIGNGAGLVMATLDAVRNAGGNAANFLDVGGGAKESVVRSALEIVLANPKVKSVLINIFGGITRGDEVARGILSVITTHPPSVPLVIRLSGTEAEAGRKLLEGAKLVSKATMDDAAAEAVVLAGRA